MTDERASFTAGTGLRAWRFMGCHADTAEGQPGHRFRVWAPHAKKGLPDG